MRIRRHVTAIMLVTGVGIGAAGCAQADATPPDQASLNGEVARVEPIQGSELHKVSLAPTAAQRLGVTTGAVSTELIDRVPHAIVPYSAVIYDAKGTAFIYTTPAPNVFVRVPVTVTDVHDDLAVVDGAPPVGTPVVTVGVSELMGTETGVGDQ
ncbi:MAG: hypothetical protein H0V92_09360 [Pseudonocardiales bacterium]|nr:hypothetical protein [Pseudonocardiales bacterium]